MVDPGRLRALLERLSDETQHLRHLAARRTEELTGDAVLIAAIKYRFIVAIETCIDAGNHVISSERLGAATDFADVFSILGKNGFLSGSMVPALQDMARFRNLLVHGYLVVDDQRVIEILKSRLDDFDAFRAQIAEAV